VPTSRDARDLKRRLASGIRRERTRRGWTQERAAEAAQIHARHYQKLEEGSVNATLSTLGKLSAAFGVDVRRLFEP
jgi:transcriptional regulator with XRE-family HTH domain